MEAWWGSKSVEKKRKKRKVERVLNIHNFCMSVIPKVGVHLEVIGLHPLHSPRFMKVCFTPKHILGLMGLCTSHFVHEPNGRVATMLTCFACFALFYPVLPHFILPYLLPLAPIILWFDPFRSWMFKLHNLRIKEALTPKPLISSLGHF